MCAARIKQERGPVLGTELDDSVQTGGGGVIQHNVHVWQAPKGVVLLFAEVDGTQDGAASQDFQSKPALPASLGVNMKGYLAVLAMGV